MDKIKLNEWKHFSKKLNENRNEFEKHRLSTLDWQLETYENEYMPSKLGSKENQDKAVFYYAYSDKLDGYIFGTVINSIYYKGWIVRFAHYEQVESIKVSSFEEGVEKFKKITRLKDVKCFNYKTEEFEDC